MTSALRSSLILRHVNISLSTNAYTILYRNVSDDKYNPQFTNSTILVENRYNVHELPVIVRKLKDFSEIEHKSGVNREFTQDSYNFHLIQEEFNKCIDLREVFTLLSKCTKITPNIALGAIERIYDIEKNTITTIKNDSSGPQINLAKGAILDKLLKVVMKTEDTQTILNILNTVSTFMEPYKRNFSEELLFRVIDNRLSVEQLCEFTTFLIQHKTNTEYSDIIDKLWVGFVEKESDINEINIAQVFALLPGLKASRRTILALLEQRLTNLWYKIDNAVMQEILNTFLQEKSISIQSLAVVGSWLQVNIHTLDDDSLLDIVSKLTKLNYTDCQVENAVEKYMKLKGLKITNHVLVIGILNYCMQFQIRNQNILNACADLFISNGEKMPTSFLKSFVYPFGFLYYNLSSRVGFWEYVESKLNNVFDKISPADLSSIILSFIYVGKYPLTVVKRMLKPDYLVKVNNDVIKEFTLIDMLLSLECQDYLGPLLPKDQCSTPITHDCRVSNLLNKIKDSFVYVAGAEHKLSYGVLVPNICSHETYFLDVMIHPVGLGSNIFNWNTKSVRNENTAILIHLPDHYCSDNEQLIGPQMLRKKHLKLLGLKVVSLKYSVLSQLYTSHNTNGLKQYLVDSIARPELCTL